MKKYRIVERKSTFSIQILINYRHWLFFWQKLQRWSEVTKYGTEYQDWMTTSFACNNFATLDRAKKQIEEWNTDYQVTIHEP